MSTSEDGWPPPFTPGKKGMKLSDLMASFGAQASPSSVTKSTRPSVPKGRSLRHPAQRQSYTESPDSSAPATSASDVSFEDDGPGPAAAEAVDSEDDNIVLVQPKRGTRELPARSTRATVVYGRPPRPLKNGHREPKFVLSSDTDANPRPKKRKPPPPTTARRRVRLEISEQTKPKRDAFLLHNAEHFLPVLPRNNYISKLRASVESHALTLPEPMPYHDLSEQPEGVQAVMKPYQLEALSFLVYMYNNGMSSILGDEMGLGKTLQTLSLFQYLDVNDPYVGEEVRPHLVVCPLSVLSSWVNEVRKWTPDLNVVRFHGAKSERERFKKEMLENGAKRQGRGADVDLVITTYETFVAENGWFKRAFAWRYCVLDEGHKVKNSASEVAQALQSLKAEHRLLLTGTPLQNNLTEMWSLLHWLYPEVFGNETAELFQNSFDLTRGKVSTSFMDDARSLLEVIMLRRMKNSPGVDLGLPPKTEVLLYVPLSPLQRFWYTRLISKMDNLMFNELFSDAKDKVAEDHALAASDQEMVLLEQSANAADRLAKDASNNVWAESKALMEQALRSEQADAQTSDWRKLMNLVMQLRKVCSHPYLIKGAAPDPYYLGEHLIKGSGKFLVLDKLIEELVVRKGKKVLLFSGFTRTLDLCEDLLVLKGGNQPQKTTFKFSRLDGSTARARRNLAIRMFNDPKTEHKVMLISTRAGGLGINLATANDVIFLDEDWNPQITLQAEARAHRIGQLNPVTIYKLCSQGTVEEQMMGRIRKKLYLSTKITGSMRNLYDREENSKKRKRSSNAASGAETQDEPQLGTGELKALLRKGVSGLTKPEVDPTKMLDWSFDTMVEKCRDKTDDPQVTAGNDEVAAEEEQQWLNSMERVETTMFESKKLHRQLDQEAKKSADLVRSDRRLGKNTTVMVNGFSIIKESMNCGDWEAVPTLAGKDPRLAEPERAKKAKMVNQQHCQHCWKTGGNMHTCTGCPRSFHSNCLTKEYLKSRGRTFQFYCPQHQCVECQGKTAESGGLIYRCRWCSGAYCEDCIDWDNTTLVGDTLPELEMIGFGFANQAHYIECQACVKHWAKKPRDGQMVHNKQREIERDFESFLASTASSASEDITPVDLSEINTPVSEFTPVLPPSGGSRKKMKTEVVENFAAPASIGSSIKKTKRTKVEDHGSEFELIEID